MNLFIVCIVFYFFRRTLLVRVKKALIHHVHSRFPFFVFKVKEKDCFCFVGFFSLQSSMRETKSKIKSILRSKGTFVAGLFRPSVCISRTEVMMDARWKGKCFSPYRYLSGFSFRFLADSDLLILYVLWIFSLFSLKKTCDFDKLLRLRILYHI